MQGERITGVILAGGEGRRVNYADKGQINLRGRPMVESVIDMLVPYVEQTMIIANRSLRQYQQYSDQVYPDREVGFHGPLMGIVTALEKTTTEWNLFVPCDMPYLSHGVITRLLETLDCSPNADVIQAHDGQRPQPLVCLINRRVLKNLNTFMAAGGRRVMAWQQLQQTVAVDCHLYHFDFRNLNACSDFA